jgi:hypothetical protein
VRLFVIHVRERETVVLWFAMKGLSGTGAYPTATFDVRTASVRTGTRSEDIENEGMSLPEIHQAILTALNDEPCSSVRELVGRICGARGTVHRRLTKNFKNA